MHIVVQQLKKMTKENPSHGKEARSRRRKRRKENGAKLKRMQVPIYRPLGPVLVGEKLLVLVL